MLVIIYVLQLHIKSFFISHVFIHPIMIYKLRANDEELIFLISLQVLATPKIRQHENNHLRMLYTLLHICLKKCNIVFTLGKFVGNFSVFSFSIFYSQKASIVLYVMFAWLVSRHVDLISHILANWVIYIFQQ